MSTEQQPNLVEDEGSNLIMFEDDSDIYDLIV